MTLDAKKLVDTYRLLSGRARRSGKKGRCTNVDALRSRKTPLFLVEDEGEVDLDDRAPVPRRGVLPRSGRKTFGENLNPLARYLERAVGRNWDAVYSELSKKMDRRGTVGGHIYQHLWYFVVPAHKVHFVDGKPHRLNMYGGTLEPLHARSPSNLYAFWIDPRDGKLKRSPKPELPKWAVDSKKAEEDRKARLRDLGDGSWLSRHPETELWYIVRLLEQEYQEVVQDTITGPQTFIVPVHKKASYPEGLMLPFFGQGKEYVVVACRSAGKKDIKAA